MSIKRFTFATGKGSLRSTAHDLTPGEQFWVTIKAFYGIFMLYLVAWVLGLASIWCAKMVLWFALVANVLISIESAVALLAMFFLFLWPPFWKKLTWNDVEQTVPVIVRAFLVVGSFFVWILLYRHMTS